MDAESRVPAATLLEAVTSADQPLDLPVAPVAAAPSSPAPAAAGARRYVLFTIAGTCYAVPQAFVTELDRVPKITMVPQVPAWLRGVANLRGDVLSVIDLRTFLELDPTSTHSGRMLVVRLLDEDVATGCLVDTVEQIVALADEDIRPPTSPLEGRLAPYLSGVSLVGDRVVAVIDVERLLRSPEIRQFEEKKD